MRITTSENYSHEYDCNVDDCERSYCSGKTHRLLFRTCDTEKTTGGERASWEDGGSRTWIEYSNECPQCHKEYEHAKFERWAKEREAEHANQKV